jgi:hypothetical protein
MRAIVYSTSGNPSGQAIVALLAPLFGDSELTWHRSVEELSNGLRRFANDQAIAVLAPDSREDLNAILAFRDLFWKHRILLILPDTARETFALAVNLFPRYMTSADQDLAAIREVVIRLMEPRDRIPGLE